MKLLLRNRLLILFLSLFLLINILLYAFIFSYYRNIPFREKNFKTSYHYYSVSFLHSNNLELSKLISTYDAQWYLRIATEGYPDHPRHKSATSEADTYAFFPFYPILIHSFSILVPDASHAAFLLSWILIILNFFSLYFVISSFYNSQIALKTNFLLFLFPFSIFYRTYYAEGLLLFLLIWFSYFLIRKRFLLSGICLSLLMVTKPNGFFLFFLYEYFLLLKTFSKKFTSRSVLKFIFLSLFVLLPFLMWIVYCYIHTGDPFYFYSIQKDWVKLDMPPSVFNFLELFRFFHLPFHEFGYSKVECVSLVVVGVLLYLSKKTLKPELWWIACLLAILPLLIATSSSFSRYQSVSFPLFLYLSLVLPKKYYFSLVTLFAISLFGVGLYFVNWYWVG